MLSAYAEALSMYRCCLSNGSICLYFFYFRCSAVFVTCPNSVSKTSFVTRRLLTVSSKYVVEANFTVNVLPSVNCTTRLFVIATITVKFRWRLFLRCIVSEITEIFVKNRDFFILLCIWRPRHWSAGEYCHSVWHGKTCCGYVLWTVKKFDDCV